MALKAINKYGSWLLWRLKVSIFYCVRVFILKIFVSYLFIILIVLQSVSTIAETHHEEIKSGDIKHSELITNVEHQHAPLTSKNITQDEQHLFSVEIIELTYHLDDEQHIECHHGHCHHASVVYFALGQNENSFFDHEGKIQLANLIPQSPILSPNLRPPIV